MNPFEESHASRGIYASCLTSAARWHICIAIKGWSVFVFSALVAHCLIDQGERQRLRPWIAEMVKKPAAFLDRDGVIIRELNYLYRLEDVKIYPNAIEAIQLLNRSGFFVIVLTNQSAVARGLLSIEGLEEIHAAISRSMSHRGAVIHGIYYCPHYPEFGPPHLRVECPCRKPRLGMIKKALEEFPIDMERSFVMGDHWSDMELALNAGLAGLMVRTGHGSEEIRREIPAYTRLMKGFHIANHALGAVRWILRRI